MHSPESLFTQYKSAGGTAKHRHIKLVVRLPTFCKLPFIVIHLVRVASKVILVSLAGQGGRVITACNAPLMLHRYIRLD